MPKILHLSIIGNKKKKWVKKDNSGSQYIKLYITVSRIVNYLKLLIRSNWKIERIYKVYLPKPYIYPFLTAPRKFFN